jgi:predicted O-linked N-acetylglucosamine transferase (SPINDLY family)
MAHDSRRATVGALPARKAVGLPETGFVFCSFNNSYKFTPDVFGIWMRLLHAIPASVLWLPESNPAAMRNLRSEAQMRGVAAARIVFAPYLASGEEHLARMALADLFLDTLPFNAHTTAMDALWAGLPVLTCRGQTFAGCVAASLLSALGLPELIADSLEVYEASARALARDAAALSRIRKTLAENRATSPLFDTARFTAGLEAAFIAMWERQRRGENPESFAIPSAAAPVP